MMLPFKVPVAYSDQFRLFVDESGDHTTRDPNDLRKRYLGVVGVAFRHDNLNAFRREFSVFKELHCDGYDADCPPILHREDIVGRKKGFEYLADPQKSVEFHRELSLLIGGTPCTVFAVVVDKFTHGQSAYRKLKHPYHYCLHVLLEKYIRFLERENSVGDVMAESRGKVEDNDLEGEYARTFSEGSRFHKAAKFKERLTSKDLKIKKKEQNVAGLQLADLFAFGATRDVLHVYGKCTLEKLKPIDRTIIELIQPKYYGLDGIRTRKINGCGRVILS